MKKPTRIGAIVAADPQLNGIVQRARELQSLEQLIRSWLPQTLAAHVKLAAVRDDTLVLSTSSAAWATKLRFESPGILAAARRNESLRDVRVVKIRINSDIEGGTS